MKTKLWSFLLLFFILSLTLLPHSAAEINVSTKLRIVWEGNKFDPKTGITSCTLSLKNYSLETLSGPFKVIIEKVDNRYVSIKPSDGYTSEGKPYFIYEKDKLAPGEKTAPRVWKFEHQCKNISIVFFRELRLFKFLTQLKCSPTAICYTSIFGEVATNHTPVADAGPDQTVFLTRSVQLNGDKSVDLDGDALSYRWSMVSLPAGSAVVLSDPNLVNPTFVVDLPGTYAAQLIVNDGNVDSFPDVVTISTQNSRPVANAGPDQTVFVTQTVSLNGSQSSDVDGDRLSYRWSFVSVPGGRAAALSDPNLVNPTFVVDLPGTYGVQLIVNDGTVDSFADVVTISTQNSRPVANAGPNQTVFVTQTATLDGSKSSDVDGDLLIFKWSFTSRPAGSAATLSDPAAVKPTFQVDLPGTYVTQLIVNDGQLDSNPATVTIITQNSPPVANAGPNQTVFVTQTVILDGSSSSDVDGDLLTFWWSLTARPARSGAELSDPEAVKPTFEVDLTGTYVAQLIVTDGRVDSAPATVTVITQNSQPIANAGPDQTVQVGQTARLDGSSSSDVDGNPLTYQWSFTSRPAGSSASLSDTAVVGPTFELDSAGTYVAQLIVNDGTVNSTPDTVTISTENSRPVGNAGPAQTVFVGDTVALVGSGSSDADLNPLTFRWSFTSVPLESGAALSNATIVNPSFTAAQPGTYVVQLIVNDGTVDSAPATVTITANLQTISVPNVVGFSQAAAESEITAAGLAVGTVTGVNSDTAPAGSVINQNPIAGISVAIGSSVDFVISIGPLMAVTVPNVVGQTQASAGAAIIAAGLTIGAINQANSSTVPTGIVMSQSPVSATSVSAGSPISLVVSLGPASVAVPNVIGITQVEAQTAIAFARLTTGTITTANNLEVLRGNVISQSPSAGSSVPEGSSVNLLISLGPLMVTVPNVVAISQAAAEAAIVSAGLSVGLITTANSDTVPVGSVISQNPAAGVPVAQGSPADLVVSLGPSGEPPVNGVLLEGPPEAFAETALRNIEQITGTEESEIGLDERGDRISRIQLLIHIEPNATVGEINGLLQTIGARIVWMMPDVPQLLIQFPDPGSLQALNDLVTQLQASLVIGEVLRGYFPGTNALPQPYDPLSLDSDPSTPDDFYVIDHLISVGAPAAWNARSGVSITNPPVVMVVDYFGAGPVSSPPFGVRVTEPRLFSRTTYDIRRFADGSPIGQHGYHVMGIIGSDFGGELPTGMFPGTAINQLEVEPLDIGLDPNPTHPRRRLMSWLDIKATILSRLRFHLSNRNVVVNTSIGFACADHRTNPPTPIICGNSLAEKQGLSWTKAVRAAGLEDKFVHVTAAGNEIPPGDIDAAYTNPFAAAALLPLVDRSGNAVPNLNNTLVVENVVNVTTGPPYRPECLWGGLPDPASGLPYGGSKVGGNIAAIGTNVRSYIRPSQVNDNFEDVTKDMTGTSMATPLVAGVASYMWAFNPALAPERIVRAIISLARPLNIPDPEQLPPYCRSIAEQGAPVINAYGSVLWVDEPVALSAAGTPADAPVRSAILDVADSAGVEGSDGVFDQGDLKVLVDKISQGVLAMQSQCTGYDWSRYDLSGDGHTGADRGNRFNLDINKPAALTYVTAPESPDMTFNENCVTDMQLLCYYAYSSLYNGDRNERDELLKRFCSHGHKTWGNWPQFGSPLAHRLGADGQGNVFAVWFDRGPENYPYAISMHVGKVDAGGVTTLGTFELAQIPGSMSQKYGLSDFFVDNFGNIIVVYRVETGIWCQPGDIIGQGCGTEYKTWARRYNVDRGWDDAPAMIHDGFLVSSTHIAADPCGNAIIVWTSGESQAGQLWALRYDANQGWQSRTQIAHTRDFIYYMEPKVSMDSRGKAIVTWWDYDPDNRISEIWTKRFRVDSGWDTESRRIAAPEAVLFNASLNIVMDSTGNAIVTWYRNGIWARHYNINTGWEPSIKIAGNPSIVGGNYGVDPPYKISMDECGNAMIVYRQLINEKESLMSKGYTIGQGWDDNATLIAAGIDDEPITAFSVHGGGNATLITGYISNQQWITSTDPYNYYLTWHSHVYARQYRTGKGWDAPGLYMGESSGGSWGYGPLNPGSYVIDRYGNATGVNWWTGNYTEVVRFE